MKLKIKLNRKRLIDIAQQWGVVVLAGGLFESFLNPANLAIWLSFIILGVILLSIAIFSRH